jgi:hypothetical protein
MKKFMKKTAISLALVVLFGSAMLVMTGCDIFNCKGREEDEKILMSLGGQPGESTMLDDEAKEVTGTAETTLEEENSAEASESPSGESVKIESATYVGGEGGDAMYEIVMVVSPELVKKGFTVGDVFATLSGAPTLDKWDGIMTYDPSMGKEEDLPDGGKRITWKTSIYFTGSVPNAGDTVTLGVNAAGQDENGEWTETEVTGTLQVKWAE